MIASELGTAAPYIAPIGAFVVGGLIGYAVKKMLKIAAVIIGAILAVILYLQYQGYLGVRWERFYQAAQQFVVQHHLMSLDTTNPLAHVVAVVGLPASGTFMAGMYIGWRKG